jgi:hypothetical protein
MFCAKNEQPPPLDALTNLHAARRMSGSPPNVNLILRLRREMRKLLLIKIDVGRLVTGLWQTEPVKTFR